MAEITLVFPNQLFEKHPAISKSRPVALIEDALFFGQYRFHQKKILLHRASMKAYEQELKDSGRDVRYFAYTEHPTLEGIVNTLAAEGYTKIHLAAPDDYLLSRRLKRFSSARGIGIKEYESPAFICNEKYINEFFDARNRYFLTDFYIEQRKRLDILIHNGDPVGGKWTFDTENRKKMPASVQVPPLPTYPENVFLKEADQYVKTHFSANYGHAGHFMYPVTRQDARRGLTAFLNDRFDRYGVYQDAIIGHDSFLFHSILTPALNIGLLTPAEVLDEALAFAATNDVPINSLEGFVRQVLGWREFVRALYIREGVRLRTTNVLQHERPIPESFWTGSTGVHPVDNVIKKVLNTSYSNHIERLMIMGNFMLLCEFNPDHVYRWFMELYIDAYDWVMVPNVYGMSQFAGGGLMSTKPYISGSNYVLKMSDYKRGPWCDIWDALYWCFVEKHRESFLANPRMSMMVRMYDKLDNQRRISLHRIRDQFLDAL